MSRRLGPLAALFVLLNPIPAWAEEQSPLDYHRRIRDLVRSGHSADHLIQAYIARTGDHSFDGLLGPTPAKRHALLEQKRALELWDSDPAQAVSIYRRAAQLSHQAGATTEAAFCLYFAAEIESENDNHQQSLRWSKEALQFAGSGSRPYLQALLHQSRAFSLWYLNRLDQSMKLFAQALQAWSRIGFQEGMASIWNNLGILYEELGLPGPAVYCYEQALAAGPWLSPETEFYLQSNLADLLRKTERPSAARPHLARARELQQVSPLEYSLLEARFSLPSEAVTRLSALEPPSLSLRTERDLALGTALEALGRWQEAEVLFRRALTGSRRSGLHLQAREAAAALGRLLETSSRWEEAVQVYRDALRRDHLLYSAENAFAFGRAVSPLWDGLVRSLVRQGKEWEAWGELQREALIRRHRSSPERLASSPVPEHELQRFLWSSALQASALPQGEIERLLSRSSQPALPSGQFTLLELWPEGRDIYVWIIRSRGARFIRLGLEQEVRELVEQVVGPLYRARQVLSLRTDQTLHQRLYRRLFEPLEKELLTRSLLVVPHKELQSLPLELLQNRAGRFLVEERDFSYLPSAALPPPPGRPEGPEVFIRFAGLSSSARESRLLRRYSPAVQERSGFSEFPRRARWVHISSHFRLDPRFWPASRFEAGKEALSLAEIAPGLDFGLLTLGACDLANPVDSVSPHWLGVSEFFLSRGVRSLVVSRWALDEWSSEIYGEFYRRVRSGESLDRALGEARRSFLGQSLRRAGSRVQGSHPFFWAGVSYIGWPGQKLYPRRLDDSLYVLSLWLAGAAAFRLLTSRKSS